MSENYEKTTPAEVNEVPVEEVPVQAEDAVIDEVIADEAADTTAEAELELELDELDGEVDPEIDMTKGEKIKTLLMKPLWSAITKWVFIFLGLVGVVLYFIATSSRSTGEAFAGALGGISKGISSFFGIIPVSMFEILICAAVVGILAYLVFIIVRTIQVKGKFHKGGLWVQFGYTLLAVASVFALLMSLCYGIFTYRAKLSTTTEDKYLSGKVTNLNFSKTMLYLIDGINNTLYDGVDNIYFKSNGLSRYATVGRSTEEIAKKLSDAFDAAAQDIPTLKGNSISAKELIFSDLYSKFQIASIYSPFTAEVCVNTDYPEVIVAYQMAKTMAVQRGYTDDGDASFIAFLVCTEYSDDYYIQYTGYFNAYLELSSKFYEENGKNLHLYMANTLKESAKKEYVQVVKELDELYGLSSDLEYVQANEKLKPSAYCDVAKLLIVNFENGVDSGKIQIDNVEAKNYGKFCNYLTNYYVMDEDFHQSVVDTYNEYHPQN